MNGAELMLKTARAAGIEVCFANPGTTEIPLVIGLGKIRGIRPVLALFEGVCTGAADGYGRMLDKPAMALLHLGPGFANGVAYLHDARRAGTPLFTTVGDHATWHRPADPPLAMDIESLARPVSAWYRTCSSAERISEDTAEAISISLRGRVSTLILPHDLQLATPSSEEMVRAKVSFEPISPRTVEEAVRVLRSSGPSAILLGGRALRKKGLAAAGRIRAATGCDLFCNSFPPYVDRGVGMPPVERIPYFPEEALTRLGQYKSFILAGMDEPVTFFGYKGIDSYLLRKEQAKVRLCPGEQHVGDALETLADALGRVRASRGGGSIVKRLSRPPLPKGNLSPEKACAVIAALQPDEAIVVDEGLTSSFSYYPLAVAAPPHSLFTVTGGAIGYGMPCAVGAAIACPDRPVINIQADGSGMYTLQALWTEARESLNITTLVCSNHGYHILELELARAGIKRPGHKAKALTRFESPSIDWATLSRGLGVPSSSVDTAEGLIVELGRALEEPGPHLIDMVLS
jgi:acetolactate synthase I/II/III large subunit